MATLLRSDSTWKCLGYPSEALQTIDDLNRKLNHNYYADDFNRLELGPSWGVIHYDGTGSVSLDGSTVTVSSAKSGDFNSASDTGSLIYRPLPDDWIAVEVNVVNVQSLPGYIRTLMVRAGIEANAPFYVITPDNDCSHITTHWRDTVGGSVAYAGNNTGSSFDRSKPLRLRIERDGTTLTAKLSYDNGATWQTISSRTMPQMKYVCLCASFHGDGYVVYDDFAIYTSGYGFRLGSVPGSGEYISPQFSLYGFKATGIPVISWNSGVTDNVVAKPLISETTQADFQAGTLTGVMATSDGNLELSSEYALSFDGVNDQVVIADSEVLRITGDLSIGIKFETSSTLKGALIGCTAPGESLDTNCLYIIFIQSDGKIQILHEYGTGSNITLTTTNSYLSPNSAYYLFVVRDATNKKYQIFINDQLKEELSFSHNPEKAPSGNKQQLAIGNDIGQLSGDYFAGKVLSVCVWNKICTDEERYNSYTDNLTGNEDGLVGYWQFNEGEGTTIYDSTSNANNGVITGATWTTSVSRKTSGSRLSPVYDISIVGIAADSTISWNVTVPENTSLTIETNLSLDGGATWQGWQQATNGGPIPGISEGTDLGNARLQIRQTLSTTDPAITPVLHDVSIVIRPLNAETSLTFEVDVSTDGGNTWSGWQPVSSGDALPGVDTATNLDNVRFRYRLTMSSNGAVSPVVSNIRIENIVDWTDVLYDDFSWAAVYDNGTYGISPWTTQVAGWLDSQARWIWDRKSTVSIPAGDVYFRKKFTLAEPKWVTIAFVCDDKAELYVDGQYLLGNANWKNTFANSIYLPAGEHVIAVKGTNSASGTAGLLVTVRDALSGMVSKSVSLGSHLSRIFEGIKTSVITGLRQARNLAANVYIVDIFNTGPATRKVGDYFLGVRSEMAKEDGAPPSQGNIGPARKFPLSWVPFVHQRWKPKL